MMDILLYGLEQTHSYMLPLSPGSKPVEDFRHLSNMLGSLWWNEKHRTNKRYLTSIKVLQQACRNKAPRDSVIPAVLTIPSVKASNLVRLELDVDDLTPGNLELKIKSAHRRQAQRAKNAGLFVNESPHHVNLPDLFLTNELPLPLNA